jgi:hypothetical protein
VFSLLGFADGSVLGFRSDGFSLGRVLVVALGNADGSTDGLRSDGFSLGRALGEWLGSALWLGFTTSSAVGLDDFVGWSLLYTVGWIDSVGLPLAERDGLAESVWLLLSFTVGLIDGAADSVLLGSEEAEGESDGRSPIQTSSRNLSGCIVTPLLSRVPPKTIVLFPPG